MIFVQIIYFELRISIYVITFELINIFPYYSFQNNKTENTENIKMLLMI